MLVDPAVVARLGAVLADAVEARPWILVERPALRAMIAGRLRSVERTLALAPVEAADMTACERHPHHALAVDIASARAEARHRYVVDFRQRGFRRVGAGSEPHDRAGAGAQRPPHRSVDRVRHDRVEHWAMRLSLAGSSGWLGSTYSSRLPLPLVSRMSAVQPCDFAASPVSSNILVFTQPTTPPPPPLLVHSVLLAS